MKLYYILYLLIFTFVSSCEKNIPDNDVKETSEMEIDFTLTYGGEPFKLGEEYQYVGRPIIFDAFSFFVSNLKLSKEKEGSSEKIEISDINFFDIDGESKMSILLDKVPVGDYHGFIMNVGIPAEVNRSTPSDFGTSHPLSDTSIYKKEWESYVFTQLKGKYDSENIEGWDIPFNYLMGKDNSFKSYSVTKEIPIIVNHKLKLSFEIEIQKLFGDDSSNLINIVNNPNTSGEGGNELMSRIMRNFATKAINCL